MLNITFKYADSLSNYEYRTQHCNVDSIEECIRIYGLDEPGVEFEFIDIQYSEECEQNNRFLTKKENNCIECRRFDWCKEIHK